MRSPDYCTWATISAISHIYVVSNLYELDNEARSELYPSYLLRNY